MAMNDDDTKRWRWTKRLVKALLFAGITVFVLLTVLSFLGGNGESYKNVIEQILTEQFRRPATIETLNEMRFYPNFTVDVDGLKIARGEGVTQSVLEAGKIQIAMNFWDVAFSTGRIKTFNIENLKADEGILLAKPLTIERMAILHPDGGPPSLQGNGTLGGERWNIIIEGKAHGRARNLSYDFSHDNRRITAALGDFRITGQAETEKTERGGLRLNDAAIAYPEEFLTGSLLFDVENNIARITGDLQTVSAAAPVNIQPGFSVNFQTRRPTIEGKPLEETIHPPSPAVLEKTKAMTGYLKETLSIRDPLPPSNIPEETPEETKENE